MSSSSSETIKSHHALRGVAAVLVLLFHFRDASLPMGQAIDSRTAFFSTGFIWVDFFFILSGFILSHVYGLKLIEPGGQGSWATRRFYIARFARIYPLHFGTLLAMIALELSAYLLRPEIADAFVNERKGAASILQHLTLTHSWLSMAWLEWNVPSWSISTEAFAYMVFPLLLPLTHHRAVWVRSLLPLAVLAIYTHTFSSYENIENQQPLARCLAGFITGMLLHALWRRHGGRLKPTAGALQVLALATVTAAMHFGWSQAIVVLGFALLIIATANDIGPLSRLLASRPLLLLGTLSYSMYMTHWIVYRVYWMYGANSLSEIASNYSQVKVYILKLTLLLVVTFILSVLTYLYVELPARKYVTRLLSRPDVHPRAKLTQLK